MKSISRIGLAAVATVLGAGVWLGCSDDDKGSTPTGDAGKPDTATVDSGGLPDSAPKPDSSTGGTTFTATLSGAQEAPARVTTIASGTATLTLSADKTKLAYDIKHTVADGTAAHIHLGEAGQAGAVVFPLEPFSAAMTGTLTLTPADVTNLEAGKLYVNIHGTTNPNGELRGQILAPGTALFVANLAGDQENPPVITTSVGTTAMILNANKDKIRFHLATTATATAAHIHRGIGSINGPVVYPLAPVGAAIDGEQAVTAADVTDLNEGRFYVNVHTAANAGGEIRGQVLKPAETLYTAALSGLNEVPPVVTAMVAGGQFILGPDGKSLRYEVSVTGGPAVTAGHIHTGVNGAVLYPLTLAPPGAKGTQAVTAADLTALNAAGLYVNLHTGTNAGGEVRAQLTKK